MRTIRIIVKEPLDPISGFSDSFIFINDQYHYKINELYCLLIIQAVILDTQLIGHYQVLHR